jgi:hypothetical protein
VLATDQIKIKRRSRRHTDSFYGGRLGVELWRRHGASIAMAELLRRKE